MCVCVCICICVCVCVWLCIFLGAITQHAYKVYMRNAKSKRNHKSKSKSNQNDMSPGHIEGAAAKPNQLPAASIKFKRHTNKYNRQGSERESKEERNSQWWTDCIAGQLNRKLKCEQHFVEQLFVFKAISLLLPPERKWGDILTFVRSWLLGHKSSFGQENQLAKKRKGAFRALIDYALISWQSGVKQIPKADTHTHTLQLSSTARDFRSIRQQLFILMTTDSALSFRLY